LKTALRSYFF